MLWSFVEVSSLTAPHLLAGKTSYRPEQPRFPPSVSTIYSKAIRRARVFRKTKKHHTEQRIFYLNYENPSLTEDLNVFRDIPPFNHFSFLSKMFADPIISPTLKPFSPQRATASSATGPAPSHGVSWRPAVSARRDPPLPPVAPRLDSDSPAASPPDSGRRTAAAASPAQTQTRPAVERTLAAAVFTQS